MNEYKIAILGNHEAVLGFKGLGVEAFGLTDDGYEGIARTVLNSPRYAAVFITEDWMDKLEALLSEFRDRALPAIVPVPSPQGSTGASIRNLKRIVELAVGSDILFKDK